LEKRQAVIDHSKEAAEDLLNRYGGVRHLHVVETYPGSGNYTLAEEMAIAIAKYYREQGLTSGRLSMYELVQDDKGGVEMNGGGMCYYDAQEYGRVFDPNGGQ